MTCSLTTAMTPRAHRRRGPGGRRVGAVALALVVMAVLAGCGTSSTAGTTKTTKPLPAGRYPSRVSKMVCASEAPHEVGLALGETAAVTRPTWVDHVYSCHYVHTSGSMMLSVKELSSWPETVAYY